MRSERLSHPYFFAAVGELAVGDHIYFLCVVSLLMILAKYFVF